MQLNHEEPVEVDVLKLPHDVHKWPLVVEFLKLRKRVFVEEMAWALRHDDAMEYEQYDSIAAVYIIAHMNGNILGGARLVRSDVKVGTGRIVYSYMIRDAYLGNLPGLPTDLCTDEPPVDPKVWELTRFTSINGALVGEKILNACNNYLKSVSANTCLFLGPPAFMRMARTMGYAPKPMGKIVGNKDGRFLAFSCDVIQKI